MLDEDTPARAADLAERILDEVSAADQDWSLVELESLCGELQNLIARINHTNASTRLSTGETVTEGLARRDVLALRQGALRTAVRAATTDGLPFSRYSRSEIRMVRQIRVGEIQARLDALAKEQRELDTLLQEQNWTTPMVE